MSKGCPSRTAYETGDLIPGSFTLLLFYVTLGYITLTVYHTDMAGK